MTIDRESPIPLYYQLKELLAGRITSDEWQPGDMLPTEEQLQEQYELSRTTVRQALKELEFEGKISRYRGRGTFVSKPKISHSPDPHFNLTAYLTQQGMEPGWQVLSAGWVSATAEVADRLGVKAGSRVYQLQRLRMANEEPIGYHITHVIPALGEAIDENRLDQGGSLDYLHGPGQLEESYANRTIEAILASDETAKLLDIVKGSPILLIRRQVFNADGVPVEDMRAMYRGDRFQYRVRQWEEK
jgi:GntR family transcriptional regulator